MKKIQKKPLMCSLRKGILRNLAQFTGKHLCQSVFLNKVAGWDSGTGVFLWILRNFSENLFYRTPLGDCFWKFPKCGGALGTYFWNKHGNCYQDSENRKITFGAGSWLLMAISRICFFLTAILPLPHILNFPSEYILSQDRSSRPEVFCKKGVLKNFAKFTGKRLCQSLFLKNF